MHTRRKGVHKLCVIAAKWCHQGKTFLIKLHAAGSTGNLNCDGRTLVEALEVLPSRVRV